LSVTSGSRVSSASSLAGDSEDAAGPSKLSKADKDLLLEYLGIDTDLPSLGPPGLRTAYQKFKAITNANTQVLNLGRDSEWKAQFGDEHPWIPTIVNFIDIFVAKSQFYLWRPLFLEAQNYPDMKDWLNTHPDRLSTKELWKSVEVKQPITFRDLKKWLAEKDREAEMKQHDHDVKGKKKASASPPKLKKKKNDDRDRAVVQRKHKKPKATRDREEEEGSE